MAMSSVIQLQARGQHMAGNIASSGPRKHLEKIF